MIIKRGSSFDLCYFAQYRNNYFEWSEINDNGLRENRLLFVESNDFKGERDRDEVKHLTNKKSFQYHDYIVGDFVIFERKGFGNNFEKILFNIIKPYCSVKIHFVLKTFLLQNYSEMFKFLKFVLDYYIYNNIDINKLTDECLSNDLYILFNKKVDTFIKDLNFSNFRTKGHLNIISINNFHDHYILTTIENCITAGYKTDYLNMNFSKIKNDEGRLIIYDTNEDITFYKFKIVLNLRRLYSIDDHIRYTLLKNGCF